MNDAPAPAPKPKKSVALSGVVAGNTAICTVGRSGNDLHYRGYDILDIAEQCEFEEIAHLLVHGTLPNRAELAAYKRKLRAMRGLPATVQDVLEALPAAAHPMDVMRTGVSALGATLPEGDRHDAAGARDIADRLLASLGSMLCYWYHASHNGRVVDVETDDDSIGGHFLTLLHDRPPSPAAVLRPAQRADRSGDGRIHVAARAGDDARGERRRVELVLGVQDQRRVHRAHPQCGWLPAMQKMQDMAADRIVVGLDLDAPAVDREVIPVHQHRAERRHQPVGDVARAGVVVVVLLGQRATERRDAGAHHVHRVRRGRQLLEHVAHDRRQAAQRLQLGLVGGQLGTVRQLAVYEQECDFLELARRRDVEDVVAAVMQVVAGAADRAQRGVAGGDAGQRDRLLRLWKDLGGFAHDLCSSLSSGNAGSGFSLSKNSSLPRDWHASTGCRVSAGVGAPPSYSQQSPSDEQ